MDIELRVDASRAEFFAAFQRNQASLAEVIRIRRMSKAVSLTLIVAMTFLGGTLVTASRILPPATTLLLGAAALAILACVTVGQRLLMTRFLDHFSAEAQARLAASIVTLGESGIAQTWSGGAIRVTWREVAAIDDRADAVTLRLHSGAFFLMPDRSFASMEARADALAAMRSWMGDAGAATAARCGDGQVDAHIDESPPVPAIVHHRSGLDAFARNLVASVRALFFVQPRAEAWTANWNQLVALIALNLVLYLVADLARIGLDGELQPMALPGALFGVPVLLLAAWAIAESSKRTERTLDLLVAFAGMLVLVECIYIGAFYLLSSVVPGRRVGSILRYAYYAPYAWLALASAVYAIRSLGLVAYQGVAALVTLAVYMALPLAMIHRDRSLWTERHVPDDTAGSAMQRAGIAAEDAFYLQPQLLEQALNAIGPERPGVIDLYFLGAAGHASQDVFLKELRYVERLFAERFDTTGRSISLINNRSTADSVPIASRTALQRALMRIGERMNPAEDILFLFLTSHGSQDHRFSLDFWPLQFNELTPATVKAALDAAGIRKRVLVISACYSGGFVEPLMNDDTLIITAAAADRNSFGCSNTADLTYFGKAFFADALTRTWSFEAAFEQARPAITEREKAEGHTPSNPRMFVGAGIRGSLAELERQLAARAKRAPSVPGSAQDEP